MRYVSMPHILGHRLSLIIAVGILLAEGLALANLRLRGHPDELNPIVLGRLGYVSIYGLERGLKEEVRDPKAAIRKWNAVAEKEGASDASLQALANIGQVAYVTGDRQQAIDAYEKLIDLPILDGTGIRFWPSLNLKHRACLELSDLALERGDLQSALKYAHLARIRHPLWAMCGVAAATEDWMIEQRITDIERATAERRSVLLETPDQAFLRDWGFARPRTQKGHPKAKAAT